MKPRTRPLENTQEVEHFQNYTDYSKTLRSGLVAYGIGGPVLFLTNQSLSDRVSVAPNKRLIIGLFLAGVALQVVLSFLNKWCAWNMYAGENQIAYRLKKRYKVWRIINDWSGLDFCIDAASIIAFICSTWLVLTIFL